MKTGKVLPLLAVDDDTPCMESFATARMEQTTPAAAGITASLTQKPSRGGGDGPFQSTSALCGANC